MTTAPIALVAVKTLTSEKLFISGRKERPKEAPFMALK
jgi:hypothetical protein